jgi:hypothetical protein
MEQRAGGAGVWGSSVPRGIGGALFLSQADSHAVLLWPRPRPILVSYPRVIEELLFCVHYNNYSSITIETLDLGGPGTVQYVLYPDSS